jgi:hypothetical protein
LALGGVYVATELHLLTDLSPDYQDTWEFLHERVSEWERLFVATKQHNGGGSGSGQGQGQGQDHNAAASFLFLNNIMMNPTALLQQGGNVAYTASAVASSLAGGVVSVLQPNVMMLSSKTAAAAAFTLNSTTKSGSGVGTSSSFSGLPELMWNALLKVPQSPPPFTSTSAGGGASPSPTASSDGNGSTDGGTSMDGTDPSHYDAKPAVTM